MKKSIIALFLCLCSALQLSACSFSNNEYLVIENYVPSVQEQNNKDGKVVVKKGATKGSYMITAKPSIPATNNYNATSASFVTVSVRVK